MDIETIVTLVGGASIFGLIALFLNAKLGNQYTKAKKVLVKAKTILAYMSFIKLPDEYVEFKTMLETLVAELENALADDFISEEEVALISKQVSTLMKEAMAIINKL